MLDLKALRRDPESARTALARRGPGIAERVDVVLELDERRRALIPQVEALRAEQKRASEEIARAKKSGEDASAQLERMKQVAGQAKALSAELDAVQPEMDQALLLVPNLPDPTAADHDTVIREVGTPIERDYAPRDHLELAGDLVDM